MLVVGLGAPKQELWVHRHQQQIRASVALCVGATIDFLAGERRRAPLWMRRARLEWLHRMATGPRYLMMRYLVTIPHALWLALRHDLLGSHRRPGRSPEGGAER